MKRFLLLFSFFTPFFATAQFYPDGTTVTAMPQLTDMNGNIYLTEDISDSGKHIVFHTFIAHSSTIGWNYFQTGALQDYYATYGPGGTQDSNIRAFMFEIDPQSVDSQIHGLGNSLGDFTAGHNIPISNNCCEAEMMNAFIDMSAPFPGLPAPFVFVVCSDKKMYQIGTNATTAADINSIVSSVCAQPSAVGDINSVSATIEIAPNPTSTQGSILLHNKKAGPVTFNILDMTGKLVHSGDAGMLAAGRHSLSFDCAGWASGCYMVQLRVGGNVLTKRLMVTQAASN